MNKIRHKERVSYPTRRMDENNSDKIGDGPKSNVVRIWKGIVTPRKWGCIDRPQNWEIRLDLTWSPGVTVSASRGRIDSTCEGVMLY